jgi:hypothetical protein
MGMVETQITASLDQLHRELVGAAPCRWTYDGRKDEYSCAHLRLTGKVVIGKVQDFNHYAVNQETTNEPTTSIPRSES